MTPETILFRDSGLLVVNKPVGVPVHGSRILADQPATLLTILRSQCGRVVHTVHRLDRPVSGVMVVALTREMQVAMGHEFEHRRVRKCYLAVVRGWPEASGTISHSLNPPRDERTSDSLARSAVSHFERIAKVETPVPVHPYPTSRYSLLALYPETGRRHQLRRHMKHISHHLIGDTSYGRGEHNRSFRENFNCRRLLLHSWSLEFQHPESGGPMRFEAPLDASFSNVVERFGWDEALASWQGKKHTLGKIWLREHP
jgi:tRNA pseudouridine65 synthase